MVLAVNAMSRKQCSGSQLGIEDNTIVMYSTDNGAETFTWPDGGTTMFRGEKNTQWEGGYRVPTLIRWPGTIKPGTVINDIGAHEDMMTTLLAAAGEPNVKEELLKGKTIGNRTYKVISTVMTLRLRSKAAVNGRVRNSSTGLMTAMLLPCATRTGRSLSLSRRRNIAPASAYIGQWLQSFKEFPPRQKPGSFNLSRVMEAVTAGSQGNQ
jgi:hypothetical protein